ncbi:hypothetical protein KI387_000686 [Taxus chinensis]|uniref:Uncharacterized protein n=1 Tax=Taxus chinensis TaxID=29808 RepID=A0AA38LKP5_TAXCH|nr:hypothetical protein KI387_000686 [Taxus chinensis]
MDSDKMLEFESAYNSICERLKTLRTIYMNQKVGNPENSLSPSRSCNTPSGITTSAESDLVHMYPAESPGDPLRGKSPVGCSVRLLKNAEESISDHGKDPDKIIAADVQRAEGTEGQMGHFTSKYKATAEYQTGVLGEAFVWKTERGAGSSKILRSLQSIEVLKEQARGQVGEQIIGAFEERSGEVDRIGIDLVDKNMSDIVGNLSHILQGRVDQVEVKAKRIAELEGALSNLRSLSGAMQEKRLVIQGLLDKAFSTAESGIL